MKALILNNNVVDVVSTEFAVSSDMTWMDCSDDCKYGWTLEHGVLTAPSPIPEKTYGEKRRKAYPSVGDQLDKIYHEGIDAWKADMVDPVKAKYPKPE